MNNDEQWQAANTMRATFYHWFASVFAWELTDLKLEELQTHYVDMHQALSSLGLTPQSSRLSKAIDNLKVIPKSDRSIELAADFAQIFLLSGRDSAPPYASYYLEKEQMLYGKPAEQMAHFLDSHELSLHPDFREPKDHVSVYLQVMNVWIQNSLNKAQESVDIAQQQVEFLDNALLNWLPKFNEHCQNIQVKTDVYPAFSELLLEFVKADREGLAEYI